MPGCGWPIGFLMSGEIKASVVGKRDISKDLHVTSWVRHLSLCVSTLVAPHGDRIDICHSHYAYSDPSVITSFSLQQIRKLCPFLHQLTPRNRILLDKLTVSHLVENFPVFNGLILRFMTVSKPVPILSQIKPVHVSHPISWRSVLILSSLLFLGFSSDLFLSYFPTKTLHAPLLSLIRANQFLHLVWKHFHLLTTCHVYLISLKNYMPVLALLCILSPFCR